MAPRATPLRETQTAGSPGETIIDARFKVVGGKKSGVLHNIKVGLIATACAVALGLATPFAALLAIELLKR